ncbi:MAG: MFS transporter [Acidimicrobiales bacterium]
MTAGHAERGQRLGLRENAWQFTLFTVITLLIGVTIGTERVALPPLARHAFGVTSILYTVSFISAFGAVKSVMNLVSGRLSDGRGRKGILLAGWAFALPYALLIMFATSWWEVIVANLFLGVNQALTWTMAVTAKIDLVGPVNRGLAVGIDESAGYIGVGLGGFAAGLLVASYGLRPAPYLLAIVVVVLGALLTAGPARETLPFARPTPARPQPGAAAEPMARATSGTDQRPSAPHLGRLAAYMSWHDRSMLAVCQAGMVNKFADSLVAAFFPLYLLRRGLPLAEVGVVVGVYAWVWGLGQVFSGALADRVGRKAPITAGTLLIAAGLALFAASPLHAAFFAGAVVMGTGMALAYPNLLTTVGDTADPAWRGGALGVYRLWRDGGYALGPLVLGGVAATAGIGAALWAGAALLAASGLVLLLLFEETDPHRRRSAPAWQSHPEWVAP